MMNKEDLLFIMSKKSVSYPLLHNKGFYIVEPYKFKSRWAYKVRYLLHLMKIDNKFKLYSDMSEELLCLNPKLIIIEGSLIYEPFLAKIRGTYPETAIKFFYTNIIKDRASVHPTVLKRYGIEAYSWDRADCDTYNLNYCKPSFDFSVMPHESDIVYDVCFIGADKGRYVVIKKLKDVFDELHLKSYIRITADYRFLKRLHSYYSDSIPYEEYLRVVSSSRCIIDLVQQSQTGTTMRVMEALFSEKKLISNNVHLVEYDFYHPDNIFILGKDDNRDIHAFLMKDYKPIDRRILDEYTTDYWLKKVIGVND